MEDRQLRIATVLVAALAALLAVLWLWEPAEEGFDPEATALIWSLEPQEVVRLEVERPEGRLVLQETEEGWRIEEPLQDRAHTRQVDLLLADLAGIERGVPIEEADPAELGLGPEPRVVVTAHLRDGAERTLAVGDDAPVGWRTYVRAIDGTPAAVQGQLSEGLRGDAGDLRDPHVLSFPVSEVRRVTLEGPEGALSVHGEGSRWWVDGFTRADPDAVDDLVVGLRELRFETFHEVALGPLDDPEREVTLDLGEGHSVGLQVGDLGPPGRLVRTSDGRVGWITPERLALLGQGPRDVGDPQAFPVDRHRSEAVEVRLGDHHWRAERGAEPWPHDEAAVLERLEAVPIVYRLDPPPAPAEAWGEVVVIRGEERRVVEIGEVVEGEFRTARDTAGGSPYRIAVADLEGLLP